MNFADPGKIAIRAIKRPASERRAFVNNACGGDAELCEKVGELIKAYEESGQFSAHSPLETEAPVDRGPRGGGEGPGARIGHYKLLQQIGEGGFGVVYMAEQHEPVRRKVALKVVKPGMDTKEVVARFEAERQALALMDHPSIARILDAGTTEGGTAAGIQVCEAPEGPSQQMTADPFSTGRPYFVMELVRGVPITEYCDRNHLTTRERLELFTTVCQAVQHAHQKGIIHRDLKPSNILVTLHDGKPVPKVIDFGVAKALNQQLTQRTLFTAYGQVVGTPQYMSPEQAEMSGLDIDTRSDIYSLGVLLYELLTGSTPFDSERLRSAGFAEMLRIIREEEPPKPSTRVSTAGDEATVLAKDRSVDLQQLCQQLRGELDWIVMKSLEKDRNRRYANASGLAADLHRYLHDEPVSACPPSAGYRLRKFARRNKRLVATAGAIGTVLLIGVVLSALMAVHALGAARVAARRLASETRARSDAEQARQAENDHRKAAEGERDRARQAEQEATRQRNLAVASEQLAQANFEKARDTVDQYLTTVSENQLLTVPGMQPLRQKLLDSALTFYERFAAERQDDVLVRTGLASAYLRLGEVHSDLREQDEARASYAKAQEAFEGLVREGHDAPDVLLQLARVYRWQRRYTEAVALCKRALDDQANNCDAQLILAETYNTLAINAQEKAQPSEALRIHRDAFDIRRQLVELDSGNPKYLGDLSSTVNNIGVLLRDGNDYLPMFRLARQYGDAAFARAPYSMLYGRFAAIMRQNVARNAANVNLQDEALDAYQAVVDAWNLLAINNPGIATYKSERYKALQALAAYQQQISQQDKAAATLRLARQSVENLPQETAEDLYSLAKVYAALARSRGPEQEAMTRRALESLARAVTKGHSDLDKVEADSAFAGLQMREDFQRLLAVFKLEKEIGKVCGDREKGDEVRLNRESLEEYLQDELARSSAVRALRKVAEFYELVGDYEEARAQLDCALALSPENAADPQTAIEELAVRSDLGRLHWGQREFRQAHQCWQVCLAETQRLALAHQEDRLVQEKLASLERGICDHYGRLGLWPMTAEYALRNARYSRVSDLTWDSRFSPLLRLTEPDEAYQEYCRQYDQHRQSLGEKGMSAQELTHFVLTAALVEQPSDAVHHLISLGEKALSSSRYIESSGYALAVALYRCGDHRRALDVLDRYFSPHETMRKNTSLGAAYLRAMVNAALGRNDIANDLFFRADDSYGKFCRNHLVSDSPKLPAPVDRFWWEFLYAQQLRHEAWKIFGGRDPPEDPWQHLIQARGYRLVGAIEEAEAELAAASAAAPDDVDVWLARARLLAKWDEIERAEAEWKRVVDAVGDDPMPWIHRGRWYAERGEHEKADADFAKAASLTPNELNKFLEAGWWVVGPYPPNLDEFCPAEIDPDPSKPVFTFDSATHRSDEPVEWTTVTTGDWGQLDLASYSPAQGNVSVYAQARIWSAQETTTTLWLSATKDARVWVNGTLIHRYTRAPGSWDWAGDPERVPFGLRKGLNTILIKGTADSNLTVRLGDHPYDRGMELARFGQWQEAADRVEEGLRRNSDVYIHEYPFRNLAACRLAAGDREALRKLYGELCDQLKAPNEQWKWALAHIGGMGPGIADDPAGLLEQAATVASNEATHWRFMWPLACYRAGRWQTVVQFLSEDVQTRDTEWQSAPLLAMTLHHLGNEDEARHWLSVCRRRLETVPNHWSGRGPLSGLGIQCLYREASHLLNGNTKSADRLADEFYRGRREARRTFHRETRAFDVAIYLLPNVPHLFLARAKRLAELMRWPEAEADFDQAVGLAPNDPDILTERATFFAGLGRPDRAARDLNAALQLTESEGGMLHRCKESVGLQAALRPDVFDELIDLRADNDTKRHLWRVRLLVHRCRGEWEAARLVSDHLPEKSPERAAAVLLDGDTEEFQRIRDSRPDPWPPILTVRLLQLTPIEEPLISELLAVAEEAAAEAEDEHDRQMILGVAKLRAGQLQGAIEHIQNAATGKHWACALPLLAMAHHGLGDREEASRWLAQADQWMQWHLARLSMDVRLFIGSGLGDSEHWLRAAVFHREAKILIEGTESFSAWRERTVFQQASLRRESNQRAEANFQRMIDTAGDDPAPWLRRAHWYASGGETEKAISDYSNAIDLAPDDALVYVMRANLLIAKDRTNEARVDFERAQAVAPDDAIVWKARGRVYEQLDQWDKALADYEKAIELEPGNVTFWQSRAEQFAADKQWDRAIGLYSELIEHNENNGTLWQARSHAYLQLNRLDEAITDADRAIELGVLAYGQRATAHLRAENYEEAIECCDEWTRLRPANAWAYQIRGQAFLAIGRPEQAIAECSKGLRLNPDSVALLNRRGNAYRRLKRWDNALADHRRAVRRRPGNTHSWLQLIDLELERDDSDTMIQQLIERAGASSCDLPTLHLYHASRSLLANRRDEYERICRILAEGYDDSNDPETLYRVALAAALTDEPVIDTGRLVDIAGRAVAGSPIAQTYTTLGLCLLRDGQQDAAIRQFNLSLDQIKDCEPLNRLGLAIAHAANGNDSESQASLRKVQESFREEPLDMTSRLRPDLRMACQLLLREAEQLLEAAGDDHQDKHKIANGEHK